MRPGLQARLRQSWTQLAFLNEQRRALKASRAAQVTDPTTATGRAVTALQTVRGVGPIVTWGLATEIFAWQQIRNGRELGALVGLVPAPFQSGETSHDLGITRAGNKHVRRVMVQLAWSWLRYQHASALAQWYQRRFGDGGAPDWDRGAGPEALDRALAVGGGWRHPGRGGGEGLGPLIEVPSARRAGARAGVRPRRIDRVHNHEPMARRGDARPGFAG